MAYGLQSFSKNILIVTLILPNLNTNINQSLFLLFQIFLFVKLVYLYFLLKVHNESKLLFIKINYLYTLHQ